MRDDCSSSERREFRRRERGMGITMDDALREDNTKKRTDVVQKKRDDVFACRCGRGVSVRESELSSNHNDPIKPCPDTTQSYRVHRRDNYFGLAQPAVALFSPIPPPAAHAQYPWCSPGGCGAPPPYPYAACWPPYAACGPGDARPESAIAGPGLIARGAGLARPCPWSP